MLESFWYLYGVETTIDARQWKNTHTLQIKHSLDT